MPEPVICAVDITKKYDDFVAVNGISFEVARGESFGLLGPNGAGKSTTMKMIAAVSTRTSGDLTVLGLDPNIDGPAIRSQLGVVPQEDNLDQELRVRENLITYGRFFGMSHAEVGKRADELLEFAQLSDRAKSKVEPLSGGMKQRVAIARGMAMEPDILLMDEPFAALDALTRGAMQDELLHLWDDTRFTVLFVTHSIPEAVHVGSRILVLSPHPGQVQAELSVPQDSEARSALTARIENMLLQRPASPPS